MEEDREYILENSESEPAGQNSEKDFPRVMLSLTALRLKLIREIRNLKYFAKGFLRARLSWRPCYPQECPEPCLALAWLSLN